jgi:bromodomain-containing protein 8
MTSVQERLNLKRIPLDKWSSKEQLCLASAVAFSGDQNWMSVSRSLKMICGDSNRPKDWFSQKFCAIEYGKLLENVETPKRKKRTASERDSAIPDTPGESIVRKLTQERIEELQKIIEEERQEFVKIREEVLQLQSGDADDAIVQEMWEQMELEKKQKELQQQHREKWMKEREERKLEMERAWRPNLAYQQQLIQQQSSMSPKAGGSQTKTKHEQSDMMDVEELSPQKHGTSPLLTSLLKSPSPAPGNLHTGSPSSRSATTAPTITNLLTSGTNIPLLSFDEPPQYQAVQNLFPVASTSTLQSAASQAPTLTKLLDNRATQIHTQTMKATTSTYAEQPYSGAMLMKEAFSMENETDDNSDGKDDENLMEVFKNLIPDDLADILADNNEMILNPELLDEEKMLVESLMNEAEGLPMDDVDEEISKVEQDQDDALKEEKEQSQQVEAVQEEVEQQQTEAMDNVVVIDDSPKSAVETGSDTDQLNENESNLVLEILSDEEEKLVNLEESVKSDTLPELEVISNQLTVFLCVLCTNFWFLYTIPRNDYSNFSIFEDVLIVVR